MDLWSVLYDWKGQFHWSQLALHGIAQGKRYAAVGLLKLVQIWLADFEVIGGFAFEDGSCAIDSVHNLKAVTFE